jgi:uncharacterized protein YegL
MATIQYAMQEAFDTFLNEQKKTPSTRITLIQFDGQNDHDVVYENIPVTAAERLNLQPRGWTPLNDAICKAIDSTGRRLGNMSETYRPDQVLMVIITDGGENMSRTYNRQDVKNRVTHQTEKYNWKFMYLGANQDAVMEATQYGMDPNWAMTWNNSQIGTVSTINTMANHVSSYVTNTSDMRGRTKSITLEERKQALQDDQNG